MYIQIVNILHFLGIVMYLNMFASSEPVLVFNTFQISLKGIKIYEFVQFPLEQLKKKKKEQQRNNIELLLTELTQCTKNLLNNCKMNFYYENTAKIVWPLVYT